MSPRLRICPFLGCGQLTNGGRCPAHTLAPRGWTHQQVRGHVLANATRCAECGEPFTAADPPTLGHIIARAHGGPTTVANGQAEHASCNYSKGAA